MAGRRFGKIPWMAFGLVAIWAASQMAWGADKVSRMTKEELNSMMGNPELVIVDVRTEGDGKRSDSKIRGAVWEDPNKATKSWAETYSMDKTIVLYWARPGEGTSARVAKDMTSLGFKKVYPLKGGWKEWSKAKFPTEPK